MAKNQELLTGAISSCFLDESFCFSNPEMTDTSPASQQHSQTQFQECAPATF